MIFIADDDGTVYLQDLSFNFDLQSLNNILVLFVLNSKHVFYIYFCTLFFL